MNSSHPLPGGSEPKTAQQSHQSTQKQGALRWLSETASTQQQLLNEIAQTGNAGADGGPVHDHGDALATAHQTAGRGRRDRTWEAAPDQMVALSLLIRPHRLAHPLSREHYSWLTLVTAAAVTQWAKAQGVPAQIKWPNDVLVEDGRKLCGILASVTPDGEGVVLGLGTNRSFLEYSAPVPTASALSDWIDSDQLPTPQAMAHQLHQIVLNTIEVFSADLAQGGIGLARAPIEEHMVTLGQRVRAELPSGEKIVGVAHGLGESGTLLIGPVPDEETYATPVHHGDHGKMVTELVEISAADVVHLRPSN